jgi:hypothetical protein
MNTTVKQTEESKMVETNSKLDAIKKTESQNKTGQTFKSGTEKKVPASRGVVNIYEAESVKKLFDPSDKTINHKFIAFRNAEMLTITDLFESFKYIDQKGKNLVLWDNAVDNDKSYIIDIGLALRANIIVLHGINNRLDKINKINRYIELINQLY